MNSASILRQVEGTRNRCWMPSRTGSNLSEAKSNPMWIVLQMLPGKMRLFILLRMDSTCYSQTLKSPLLKLLEHLMVGILIQSNYSTRWKKSLNISGKQ
ncbi:hypothetical protein I7I50_12400 [Histoplasma capsulatum G186AR]|uniref:Uncharacterized protein n=1 Tax=Ajellomyces capsulatus TaxID=5037 RepID=A0A8H7YDA7_AJECA|nr:hypothetical protein I7I52_11292 [Histoplasma capsulatum]QSS70683.1 hypothetical protein I7I50_12400 [Histoplasma capsulatum G186AR]